VDENKRRTDRRISMRSNAQRTEAV